MQFFEVGGAVRDRLLGIPINDRDWLVVGASPEQMTALGYRPVGRGFPVFLHPETHEEYALARTERKHGIGHDGFIFYCAPNITVEDDLQRRDLTINAMARQEDGTLIDPFGGLSDLHHKILRHVSEAFVEDPLRVFRLARFAARFSDFTVAPETHALMKQMANNGELTTLSAERVWQELVQGLSEKAPRRMIEILDQVGALSSWLPEVSALKGIPQSPKHHSEKDAFEHVLLTMDAAAQLSEQALIRFSVLCHDLGKAVTPMEKWPKHPQHNIVGVAQVRQMALRLKAPQAFLQMGVLAARWHDTLFYLQAHPHDVMAWENLFYGIDLWRRPHQWQQLILVVEADYRGRLGYMDKPFLFLQTAQKIAQYTMAPFTEKEKPSDEASRKNIIRERIKYIIEHSVC